MSEELGGLRAEYRHGWRGRRAQGRGGSVWRGGKGREGVKACGLVEEGWWRELAREWQGAGVCLRGLEACGQSIDMAGEGGGRREGAGQCGEVGAPTCCFADASLLFLFSSLLLIAEKNCSTNSSVTRVWLAAPIHVCSSIVPAEKVELSPRSQAPAWLKRCNFTAFAFQRCLLAHGMHLCRRDSFIY